MQENQKNYEQKIYPKNIPSDMNRQNNSQQIQKVTPNNQQRMTPQKQYQQYQNGTPYNGIDQRMSPHRIGGHFINYQH